MPQHLKFTGGQVRFAQMLSKLCRHLEGNALLSGVDFPYRVGQVSRRGALEQVTAGSRFESTLHLNVSFRGGQHRDAGVAKLTANRYEDVDAVHIRQSEVEQRHVRPVLPKLLNRFAAVFRLRHDLHIRLVIDDLRDPFAQQGVIINAKHTNADLIGH